tara:strand:- start:419 stop:1078 length:660 start_codon:yes stop_codon:yes gene_type:complete
MISYVHTNQKFSDLNRSWVRLIPSLACCGLLVAFLSACSRSDVSALKDRHPSLSLETFFEGKTVAYGIFEDRFGNLKRQFRVNITGTIEGGQLRLEETFLYDDGERDSRIWQITKVGTDENGHVKYKGTAIDIDGEASGRVAGNALNWQYDVTLEMGGGEFQLHFDDWIYQQDEHVAINRAYLSKYNIEIGSVTIVFLRGKAANAIGPLNLERWAQDAS